MTEIVAGAAVALLLFLGFLGVNVLPLVLIGVLLSFAYLLWERRGPTAAGRVETPVRHRVGFDEIGGQEHAKRELMEALDFLRYRDRIRQLGIRPLKGILLAGPPGTGKTLMAKAAATYTDSAFVAASGSEFVEMYVGIGAQRVRELFRRARQSARREGKDSAIIFIDEIDVIGGRRGAHSHQEYDQTLNQLLTEMDGMQTTSDPLVLVMAATNRIDALDPALLRPGRFDRIIKVDLPDKEGRLHILQIQTRNKPLAPSVDLEQVARETFGFSGAQLESLANEAAIIALREGKDRIEQSHFRDAIDKVLMGERTGRVPSREELRRVAVHELGHAIVSEIVRPGSVSHITISPRGNALGYVRQVPEGDTYLYTKDQLDGQIMVALAGAVAEELVYGNRSTGAQNDFEQASRLARTEVECGLSELGIVDAENLPQKLLDEEIRKILSSLEIKTKEMLERYRPVLEEFSGLLVQEESLDGDAFRAQLARRDALSHAG
ncbi:MAG: AAA family ATPase [Alicyclobacillaceae bacterium]|nr:AAA family ATPase [Alicyclobacillaceae bacterium]